MIGNVIKHARAETALVQLTVTDAVFTLTVEDDGIGFNTDRLTHTHGIGWANIRNRGDFLDGTVHLDPIPGKGTSAHSEVKL